MSVSTPLMNSSIDVQSGSDAKTEASVAALGNSDGWKLTNMLVLQVTCAAFFLFVIGEVFGAVIGNSWSLLGDAAAMSVDVMTYFTNMLAERIKARDGNVSLSTKMILEVYVPSFSVCALLGVTAYVTVGAVHDILYKPTDDDVDIYIMYGFAIGNAVVDIVSVYMFWLLGKDVFQQDLFASKGTGGLAERDAEQIQDAEDGVVAGVKGVGTSTSNHGVVIGSEKNLNMISAFTHVGGDTLRTFSIFFAAVIANYNGGAAYLCDAWAAIIVTITIVFMVLPLIREIYRAYYKISADMALSHFSHKI